MARPEEARARNSHRTGGSSLRQAVAEEEPCRAERFVLSSRRVGLLVQERVARARRRLNQFAAVGVLVWLGAFAAGPFLHSRGHRDDHVHLPSGAIVHVEEREAPRSPPSDPEPSSEPSDAPSSHGNGSLAHLIGAAVLGAHSFIRRAPPQLTPERCAPASPAAPLLSSRRAPRASQGPPAIRAG